VQRGGMVHQPSAEPAYIGDALVSTRAAIDLVASHGATRVTVHAVAGTQILTAAQVLARSAGVTVRPIWWDDGAGCDIVISAGPSLADA
jgi:hypothetical protein